jgi:hypothetical protein
MMMPVGRLTSGLARSIPQPPPPPPPPPAQPLPRAAHIYGERSGRGGGSMKSIRMDFDEDDELVTVAPPPPPSPAPQMSKIQIEKEVTKRSLDRSRNSSNIVKKNKLINESHFLPIIKNLNIFILKKGSTTKRDQRGEASDEGQHISGFRSRGQT